MITKKDIIKMAKHVTRRGHNIPDRKLIHANRDWLIGMLIFIVIVIIGALYNTKLFESIGNIEKEIDIQGSSITVYKSSIVDSVLKSYSERADRFKKIRGENIVVTVPEIEEEDDVAPTTDETSEGVKDVSEQQETSAEEGDGSVTEEKSIGSDDADKIITPDNPFEIE